MVRCLSRPVAITGQGLEVIIVGMATQNPLENKTQEYGHKR